MGLSKISDYFIMGWISKYGPFMKKLQIVICRYDKPEIIYFLCKGDDNS